MKPIKIVPTRDGRWRIVGHLYNAKLPDTYPSAIDAMIAARQSHPASAVCWIAKPTEEE